MYSRLSRSSLASCLIAFAVVPRSGAAQAEPSPTATSEDAAYQPSAATREAALRQADSPTRDLHALRVAESDVHALSHLVDEQAERAESGNSILPPLAFTVGALAIGGGIVSYVFAPSGVRPLGAAMVGLGIGSLTLGVVSMLTSTPQGDRRIRFRAALEHGLDPIEFGRFEGEIRAEVQTMMLMRRVSWILGLGMFVGGGVALAMVGTSGIGYTQDVLAWSIPIGAMVAGAVGAVGGLIPSQVETDWERYQRGEYRDPPVSVSVSPWISSDVAGVIAGGQF